jgi:hypothetical protein
MASSGMLRRVARENQSFGVTEHLHLQGEGNQ